VLVTAHHMLIAHHLLSMSSMYVLAATDKHLFQGLLIAAESGWSNWA